MEKKMGKKGWVIDFKRNKNTEGGARAYTTLTQHSYKIRERPGEKTEKMAQDCYLGVTTTLYYATKNQDEDNG
jgi:hypothetical protein